MNGYAKVVGAAIAVIAVGAITLTLLSGSPPPGNAAAVSPRPSGPPSASPRVAEAPRSLPPASVITIAGAFVRPFSYALPIEPTFDFGATTQRYHEIRVPEWAEQGHPGGLIAQAIGGGRVDRCDAASAPLTLRRGPEAVFDYLASIPELTVTDQSDVTVDGRPARQATVTAAETEACPALHVWAEEGEPFIGGTSLRLVAVDVDGEHIVLTTYGEPYIPEWPALADHIIGSIRFSYMSSTPAP
jgi:hypothetical protein